MSLKDLYVLNVDHVRPASPELMASTTEVINLTSQIEGSWGEDSSSSSSSPGSDTTIKQDFKSRLKFTDFINY